MPPPPSISSEDVLGHLRAFPRGTAPGPSGLHAQHLLDALVSGEEDALGQRLAPRVNWLAAGGAPAETAPHLAGARFVALLEPNGRPRPIAVGEVFRRLTAKCLCAAVRPEARDYLWPLLSGVAVPLGMECAVHSVRRWSNGRRIKVACL